MFSDCETEKARGGCIKDKKGEAINTEGKIKEFIRSLSRNQMQGIAEKMKNWHYYGLR